MEHIYRGDKITLGVCYYPEHWDRSLWKSDLQRMLSAGITVVRVAEFAWSKIELHEGEYDFSFFDDFLEAAKEVGMQVIFCTPTATPPAWLTEKYPEVLNARKDGVLYHHGARRHYNYNSSKYQQLCANIVEQIAHHYAKHESIIGWQIDNEFNCEHWEFYSESDTLRFREFLKEKYKSLDCLNDAWGTVFWNQTYTSWNEIYVPRHTTVFDNNNPHQLLDYKRFISDSVCRFAKIQSDILKKYIKHGDFITTNSIFGNLDVCRLTEESLNFISYDSYPNFGYCLADYEETSKEKNDRKWSRNLTEARAISPIFAIMEQQSGSTGNHIGMEGPAPRPGQITLWTMQSIAHGADFVSYFRWRTCTFGSEMYWHGILDYSGRDNSRLREIQEISGKVARLSDLAGSRYEAKVGLLKEYDNVWDAELDAWHGRLEWPSQSAWFKAAQKSHTPMDFCYLDHMSVEDMKKYKLLIYPHAVILRPESVEKLHSFVEQGGKLLLGCRAGYKDENGRCVMSYLPGLLRTLCGTDVLEYTFVAPDEKTPIARWKNRELHMQVFNDRLAPIGAANVEAVYENAYYEGTPALISHKTGLGESFYFGGVFDEDTAQIFLEELEVAEPYKGIIDLPEVCEIAVRRKDDSSYIFVLNYGKEHANIQLHQPMFDLFAQVQECGSVTLGGYESKVYLYKHTQSTQI